MISWSFERGRLQYQMDYEDIITHIDGLERWRDLSEGGVGQLLSNYIQSPAHCPLHSFMAAAAFMFFGVHDWAPYVLNVFMLFAFLALVRRETRTLGFYPSILAVIGALFVPLSFQSIHQFRPDFPCALATLWGMVVFPRWRQENYGKMAAFSGALFGLALLAKPPFFPYTLAMGGLPLFFALVEGIKEKKSATGAWLPLLRSWPFFLATAVVAGPHYIIAWRKILDYIRLNQFGENAHVWKMTGGLDFQLVYHIFGYSGAFMLGHAVWLILALSGCGLLLSLVLRKRDAEHSRQLIRLLSYSVWAWIFIAWNPHMNPFFGLTFQYGIVLVAVFAAAWILRLALDAAFPLKAAAVIPCASVASIILMAFPFTEYDQKFTRATPEIRAFAKNLPIDVYEALTKWRRLSDSGYTLLSTYGIVSSHRLQWIADKNRQNFRFFGVPFWPIDQVVELFDQETKENPRVDFAVISEPGAEGVFEELPNAETTGSLLQWFEGRKEYRAVETILTPSGKKYILYMAAPNFSIFESSAGLGQKTGPVNLAGMPMVRNVEAPEVSLDFDSPASGQGLLELSFHAKDPIAAVKVTANSLEVADIDVTECEPQSDFCTREFKVALVEGKNPIILRLYDRSGNLVQHPSMILRRLRISAPGDSSPLDDILRKTRMTKTSPHEQSSNN